MAKRPVHLFVGLYDSREMAERDFGGLGRLHAQGLVGAYDAAVLTRDADGTPTIDRKKRTGHAVWTGLGIGALVGVLTPFVAVPFALLGAGAGALVRHAQGSLPKKDAEELAEALASGEAALAVASDAAAGNRIEQMFPNATRRIGKQLDVDRDDFAAALRQAEREG